MTTMIKGIIEKIIMSTFGKFIQGIQGQKLSVDLFGGNFQLQNISLNHQYFDSLRLPFTVAFSHIGKLHLKASISKLSSVPVECLLDNIFVILKFRAGEDDTSTSFESRKAKIFKQVNQVLQNSLKKLKQQKKEDGMMARFGKKVIDNLQLTIRNVHIRFQQANMNSKYAWGLTLEEIAFRTTDKEWKPCFVQRNDQGKETLFKMMEVSKLNIYWESGQGGLKMLMQQSVTNQQKKSRLLEMIKQQRQIVISITSNFKLILNPAQQETMPLYELNIQLSPIKLQLQRIQLIQINDFIKKNLLQNNMIVRSMGKKQKISQFQRQKMKQFYQQFIAQILQKQQNGLQLQSSSKQNLQLNQIFQKIQDSQLKLWSLGPIKKKVKIIREMQLKKKKSGWFSRGNNQLTQQQKQELNNFIESSFEGQKSQRQPHCLLFKVNTQLKGAKLSLIQHKGQIQQQIIQFTIGKIFASLSKSQDDSCFQFALQIKSIKLSLFLSLQQDQKLKKKQLQIITSDTPKQYKQLQSDDQGSMQSFDSVQSEQPPLFLSLKYQNTLLQDKTIQKKSLQGNVQRLTIIYKQLFMQKFKQFFKFSQSSRSNQQKPNIQKQFDELDQDEQQNQNTKIQKVYDVKLNINSPVFLCPLSQSACWCLNLGNLNISSIRTPQCHSYPMKVSSAFMRYYPNMKQCLIPKKTNLKGTFSLIHDMNFTINYHRWIVALENVIQLQLPRFKVTFTQQQYHNLLSLTKVFKVSKQQQLSKIQKLKENRRRINQEKVYQASILKKEQSLMNYKQFHGIISGQYLYLYNNQKELSETDKVSLKNAKIMLRNSYNQNDSSSQDQNQLQIINQNQICLLRCHSKQDLQKWHQQIQKKCRQFKTITDLMNDYDTKQEYSARKNSSSMQDITQQNVKKKIISIKVSQIQFEYINDKDQSLLDLMIRNIEINKTSTKYWSQSHFQMQLFTITDRIYKFHNEAYQTLLQAKGIQITQKRGQKSSSGKTPASIQAKFQDIYLNWKPDVLLILMNLMKQHFKGQKQYRVDDDIQQSRQQHFKQVYNDQKFMAMRANYNEKGKGVRVKEKRDKLSVKGGWMRQTMSIDMQFMRLQINMVHRQTHLVMLKFQSKQIDFKMSICDTAKFISGSIHHLDIYDMTGYPRTDYSSQIQHQPYLILTKKTNNSQPLINYRYSSYNLNSLPNQQNIDAFMWAQISPLRYQYYQQITFRMIDYILIQVILLINQPEMLTVNQNLMQQLGRKQKQQIQQKPIKVLFSQYEQLIRKLIHPTFMDMFFSLKQITLVTKAQKDSHIYYQTTIDQMVFENKNIQKNKRFIKEKCQLVQNLIYQEQYMVEGTNCIFEEVVTERGQQILFGPFQMRFQLNKLIFQDQINLLFPQLALYDRSFLNLHKISNIKIPHLSRLQYLNINKLVNFNFTFDDQCDQMFIHNFKVTKLLSPKPIVYDLLLPELQLTADYNARQADQRIWKLFKATIRSLNMTYRRTKQLDTSMTFLLGFTQFKGYQYQPNKLQPQEHYLLTLGNSQKQSKDNEIIIENKTSGQKIIQMNIGDMNIRIRTGLLQLILQYTLIQNWVFPILNKYQPQLLFYATANRMTAQLAQDSQIITRNLLKQKASQKVIKNVIEGNVNLGTFRLQGLLCYKFHRKKDLTLQEYESMLAKKLVNYDSFQKMEPFCTMNVILNTDIFRSWVDSKASRKIIQKFTFTFQQTRNLRVADDQKGILKQISKRKINIDRIHLKISFKDVILMQNILNQIAVERQYISYLNEKTGKIIGSQGNNEKLTQSSSFQNFQIKVQGLSLYLINSRRDTFLPILKITMNTIQLVKANTFKKDILKGQLSLAVYYFNNVIFKWQPILQKSNLIFHKLTYYQQNNSVFGSFQSIDPIMLNISRQVLISIKQTMDAWKTQSQQQQKKFQNAKQQNQPLQFVSHYIIRNQTGYPLQLFNDRKQLIRQIAHNSQMDYQLQVQNYNQQDQIQIFVGFNILHPTYKLKSLHHVSLNNQKAYQYQPVQLSGQPLREPQSKIIIKPVITDGKKVLMIKSSKYVQNYVDGQCQIFALPFDHSVIYTLPAPIHKSLKVSLYQQKITDYFRYIGKNGTLNIMPKWLVYNYSPIPLSICGKIAQPSKYVGITQKLVIQGIKYKQSFLRVIKNQKAKQYYIVAQCYIVDYYGLSFIFDKDKIQLHKKHMHQFKQQDIVKQKNISYKVYILPEAQAKFKVKMGQSSSIGLKTSIGKSFFSIPHQHSLCPFTVNSYLSPVQNSHINQFTRVIEITPQYMLSNATKSLIKICQTQSCSSITLNPYERVPFFWENVDKPKFIKIALYDGINFWGFSGNLTIQKSTQTVVLRNSSDPSQYRVFSLQIQNTNTVSFIHIIQPSSKYMLTNKVPGTVLRVYQLAIMDDRIDQQSNFPKQLIFNVEYNQQIPFGYELPLQSHKIHISVQLDNSIPQFNRIMCVPETLDDIQKCNLQSKTLYLKDKNKKIIGQFILNLCFENNIKKVRLVRVVQPQQVQNTYQYSIKIPKIGISCIGFYKQFRKEIMYVILQATSVMITGNKDYSDTNLLISSCRIQNQLKNNAIFPVIFENIESKQAKYFINFMITKSAKNSRLIHYIGCSINRSWLTVTSQELQVIQQNINHIQKKQANKGGQVLRCEMFKSTLPDPQQSIYFVAAEIHPLKSNITFRHVNQWGGRLLKTFSSMNQCNVSAQGLALQHFNCQSFQNFFGLLLKHYQASIVKMILPMIGNLTILGSPALLAQKIGSGFKDLVELPAQGFEIGPLQGTKGIAKGASSLLSNTVSGAFGTVQSLTGSIGNGINLLVDNDSSFAKQRQNIKNDRSQHVLGGLANGAKSIANGLARGVTGVFTQPVKQAEKYGLPGFFLGAAQGLTGLILKPISGIVDAASKTAQGIKNTPDFFSQKHEQKFRRQHNPRPFYNLHKQYRHYDKQMADLIKFLQQEDQQKFANLSWCGYYLLISVKKQSKPILIVSYEYLFIYDFYRQKLIQTFRCDSIVKTEVDNKEQAIRLFIKQKKSQNQGSVSLRPDGGIRKLAQQLDVIIRYLRPSKL